MKLKKLREEREKKKLCFLKRVMIMKMTNLTSKTKNLVVALMVLSVATFSVGCGGDGGTNLQIPGVKGPTVTLTNDNVLIAMVFENIQLQGGLRYNIPKYNHSYIEISPDLQSDGTLMSVNVSLKDVFNDQLQLLDPQTLPGGRPLPGVATGKLPAVAFTIEKFKGISFYLGPKFFGIFVPLKKLDIAGSIVTARFYAGKIRAGNLSIVGQDSNGENGGLLLLLDLSKKVKKGLKKRLKSVARKSRRRRR